MSRTTLLEIGACSGSVNKISVSSPSSRYLVIWAMVRSYSKVPAVAHPTNQPACIHLVAVIRRQALELIHPHMGQIGEGGDTPRDTLLEREHGLLVLVCADGDDDFVEEAGRPTQDIFVPRVMGSNEPGNTARRSESRFSMKVKETEMHVTVFPHLHKSQLLGEILAVSVLEDKKAAWGHQSSAPGPRRAGYRAWVRVRRIRKNQVRIASSRGTEKQRRRPGRREWHPSRSHGPAAGCTDKLLHPAQWR